MNRNAYDSNNYAVLSRYCEIIFIRQTFNIVYFMGRTMDDFNIQLKFHHQFSNINDNLKSANMPIVIKLRNLVPMKFNEFKVIQMM